MTTQEILEAARGAKAALALADGTSPRTGTAQYGCAAVQPRKHDGHPCRQRR